MNFIETEEDLTKITSLSSLIVSRSKIARKVLYNEENMDEIIYSNYIALFKTEVDKLTKS